MQKYKSSDAWCCWVGDSGVCAVWRVAGMIAGLDEDEQAAHVVNTPPDLDPTHLRRPGTAHIVAVA